MGVIAGSADKWSKTEQWDEEPPWDATKQFLNSTWYQPLSKACSSNARLWSRPEKSTEADALRAKGTMRREILALLDILCLRVSASVEMSPSPNSTAGTSTGPENRTKINRPNLPLPQTRRTIHTWLTIHESMYCGAKTVLTWRSPNFELCPGTNPSTRVTKAWLTSRLTRRIKH